MVSILDLATIVLAAVTATAAVVVPVLAAFHRFYIKPIEIKAQEAHDMADAAQSEIGRLEQFLIGYDDQPGAIPDIQKTLEDLRREVQDAHDETRELKHQVRLMGDETERSEDINLNADEIDD